MTSDFVSDALRLALVPGKGRGLVAARSLACGELLLVSRAFKIAPVDSIVKELAADLLVGSEAERRAVLALCDGGTGKLVPIEWLLLGRAEQRMGEPLPADAIDMARLQRIVRLNAHGVASLMASTDFRVEDSSLCGLWLLPSLMNHDCAPSAACVPLDAETLAFVSTRSLSEGEEITDSYINSLQSRRERQEALLDQKGFTCRCVRCTAEADLFPEAMTLRLLRRFEAAHAQESADAFLRLAGGVRSAMSAVLAKATAESEIQHMLRASLMVVDVGIAIVYESPQCTVKDHVERAIETLWQVCLTVEQASPLSEQHLEFAEKRLLLCKHEASYQDALLYFFVVWALRNGASQPLRMHGRRVGNLFSVSQRELQGMADTFVRRTGRPGWQADELQKACNDGFFAMFEKAGAGRFGAAMRLLSGHTSGPLKHVLQDRSQALDLETMD